MSELNFNTKSSEHDFINIIQQLEQKRYLNLSLVQNLSEPYQIRVAIYLRVSSKLQAGKNKVSLKEQEEQVRAYAQEKGWIVTKVYCDKGISGTHIEGREQFKQMLEDGKNGMSDVILSWSTDRFARNVEEMTALRAELKKCNLQVTTVKEPTEVIDPRRFALQANEIWKKAIAYLQDLNAEQDNIKRTLRFELGKLGKARKGKIPVKVPYGYRKVVHYENGDPNKKIERDIIEEDEAIVVQEIFSLYDKKSLGIKKIAEQLSIKGTLSPRGNKWCYSTVKYTLQNPTYTGLVRFGWRLSQSKESRARLQQGHEGIITQGEHPKIIEPEQYKRVQEKMAAKKKLGGRAASSKGLLTGLLKCGRCGGGTYITTFPNWLAYKKTLEERTKHKASQVYLCSRYASYGRSGCSKRYVIYAERIHKIVVDKITKLVNSEEARKAFAKQMKRNNTTELKTRLVNLNTAMVQLDEKNNRIKIAYTNGVLSLEEFTNDRQSLQEEKQRLIKDIDDTSISLIKEEKATHQSELVLFALTDFEKNWASAEFFEKKELLQMLVEKIVVKDNDIQINFVQDKK